MVSGDQSGFIDFWDLTTGKHIERRKSPNNRVLPNNHVTLLAFTPDGKFLASGDHLEVAVTLWDAASRKEIRQLKRSGAVQALAFSPDGAFLVCVSDADSKKKNGIQFWDVKTGKIVHEMSAGYAWSVAFSPDGKTLASAEAEEDDCAVIVLRDVSSGKRLRS